MRFAESVVLKSFCGVACTFLTVSLVGTGGAFANDINYVSSILWSNVRTFRWWMIRPTAPLPTVW